MAGGGAYRDSEPAVPITVDMDERFKRAGACGSVWRRWLEGEGEGEGREQGASPLWAREQGAAASGLPRPPWSEGAMHLRQNAFCPNVPATAPPRPAVKSPSTRRQSLAVQLLAQHAQRPPSSCPSIAWHDGVNARLLYSYHWHLRRRILDCPLGPCDACLRARHICLGPRRRDTDRKGLRLVVAAVFPLHPASSAHRGTRDGPGQ